MHQRRIIRSIEIEMIIGIIVGSNTVLGIMTNSSSNSGINIRHANMKVEVVDFMNNEGIRHKRDHVDKAAAVVVVGNSVTIIVLYCMLSFYLHHGRLGRRHSAPIHRHQYTFGNDGSDEVRSEEK